MPRYEFSPKLLAAGSALAIGGLLVGACSNETGNNDFFDNASIISYVDVSEGHIKEGTNIRHDPIRPEGPLSNACAVASEDIQFNETEAIERVEFANGPWIGFDLETLPHDVQDDCSDDVDGIVWASKNYIDATTEPAYTTLDGKVM